uniref:Outer capsid protein VP2 n=1 Tax=Heramatsu virus TaxID=1416744 RepID=U5XJL7_9REOV|nr:outer capsid protein VP2 [Heramatsu virus]
MDEFGVMLTTRWDGQNVAEAYSYDVVIQMDGGEPYMDNIGEDGPDGSKWVSVRSAWKGLYKPTDAYERMADFQWDGQYHMEMPEYIGEALRSTLKDGSRRGTQKLFSIDDHRQPRVSMDSELHGYIKAQCNVGSVHYKSSYSEMTSFHHIAREGNECDHRILDFGHRLSIVKGMMHYEPMRLGLRAGWKAVGTTVNGLQLTHDGLTTREISQMSHQGMKNLVNEVLQTNDTNVDRIAGYAIEASQERPDPEDDVPEREEVEKFRELYMKLLQNQLDMSLKADTLIPGTVKKPLEIAIVLSKMGYSADVPCRSHLTRGLVMMLSRAVGDLSAKSARYVSGGSVAGLIREEPFGRDALVDSKQSKFGKVVQLIIKSQLMIDMGVKYEPYISDVDMGVVTEIQTQILQDVCKVKRNPTFSFCLNRLNPRRKIALERQTNKFVAKADYKSESLGSFTHDVTILFHEKERTSVRCEGVRPPWQVLIWEERLWTQKRVDRGSVSNMALEVNHSFSEFFGVNTLWKGGCPFSVLKQILYDYFFMLSEIFDRHFLLHRRRDTRVLSCYTKSDGGHVDALSLEKVILLLFSRYCGAPEIKSDEDSVRWIRHFLLSDKDVRITMLQRYFPRMLKVYEGGAVAYEDVMVLNLLLLLFCLTPGVEHVSHDDKMFFFMWIDRIIALPFTLRNLTDAPTISGFITFLQFFPHQAQLKEHVTNRELRLARVILDYHLSLRVGFKEGIGYYGIREHFESWCGMRCSGIGELFSILRPVRTPERGHIGIYFISDSLTRWYPAWRVRNHRVMGSWRGDVWIKLPSLDYEIEGHVHVKRLVRMSRGRLYTVLLIGVEGSQFGNDHMGPKLMN